MTDIEKKRPSSLSDSPERDMKDKSDYDEITLNKKPESDEDLEETRHRILREHEKQMENSDLKQQDAPILPFTQLASRNKDFDMDAIATQPSVYDNEAAAQYFQPHENYENKHRFDPKARWTWREELPLINKMDLKSEHPLHAFLCLESWAYHDKI